MLEGPPRATSPEPPARSKGKCFSSLATQKGARTHKCCFSAALPLQGFRPLDLIWVKDGDLLPVPGFCLPSPLILVPKSGILLTNSVALLLLHPALPQLTEASGNFPSKCLREHRCPGDLQGSRLQDPPPVPPGEILALLEPFGLAPDAAAGDTAGSKCSASWYLPSSTSSQERLSQCPGLMNSPSALPGSFLPERCRVPGAGSAGRAPG